MFICRFISRARWRLPGRTLLWRSVSSMSCFKLQFFNILDIVIYESICISLAK